MKDLITATVALDTLVLPGDFQSRLDPERLKGLIDSIKDDGLIHPPLVRRGDRVVICGSDRIAAMKLAGMTEVEVRLCSASDTEVTRLRAAENIFRRADVDKRDEYLREYVAALQATPEVSGQVVREPGQVGRPRSLKKAARDVAAAELGISERTLRRAEAPEPPAPTLQPEAPPVPETFGLKMPWDLANDARAMAAALEGLDELLRKAQALATRLGKVLEGRPALGQVTLQALKGDLHSIAHGVRSCRPYAVCLYCKCNLVAMANCPGCKGSGYLVEHQLAGVPPELKATGEDRGIYVRGNFTRLADL